MSDLLKYEKAAKQEWGYFDKFASLLSEKQMTVVRNYKATTACIDLSSNTITIPFYATEDKDIFLLMLSHEVSHALHTPTDWYKIHNDEKGTRSDTATYLRRICTNIVEDIRIEKLIRRKFPGFVSVYNRGYSKLLGMDFFSINEWDKFKLHDRINAYAKLGKLLHTPLTTTELSVYKYLANAETFDDVDVRAEYLYQLVKDEIVNGRNINTESESGGCGEDLNDEEFDTTDKIIENDGHSEDDEAYSNISVASETDEERDGAENKDSSLPIPNETPDEALVNRDARSETEDRIESSIKDHIDTTPSVEFRPEPTGIPLKSIW